MPASPLNQIWIVGDLRTPRLFGMGLNILSKARLLAQEISGQTAMVLMDAVDHTLAGPACGTIEDPLGEGIAHGADPAEALARSRTPMGEMKISGIASNVDLHSALLSDPVFNTGGLSIHYQEKRLEDRGQADG